MLYHLLTNSKIQRYYQIESKFNLVYSKNNLPKINDEAYIINLDKYKSTGSHWIVLNMNGYNVTYFNSLGFEYTTKESEKFIGNKYITINVYRIQPYDSIMCGYFCIGFIDHMLNSKRPADFNNFSSQYS